MGNPVPALISELRPDEWRLFRRLRLAALAESPDAFSPTLAEAEKHDCSHWKSAAQRFASSSVSALLIARPEQGLVSAVRGNDGVGHIGAMWVRPDARGEGLGSALLDAALEFLCDCGCVELSVTESNDSAIRLYERRGFEMAGAWEPLRDGSALRNLSMRRERGF